MNPLALNQECVWEGGCLNAFGHLLVTLQQSIFVSACLSKIDPDGLPLPDSPQQMRENILKKESEVTMVEALTKMANVHEIIVASLDQAAANGVSSPTGSAR